MPPLAPFAIASFLPGLCLAAACVWGGFWPAVAVLVITVVVFFLDKLPVRVTASDATGHRLSEVLGVAHFVLLGLSVWAMGTELPTLDKALIIVAAGLFFGQISNSNAHELIHRADRWAFRLGAACYASILFGHHTSAHRLVHHIHAATEHDPATARRGEGFWAYLPRTWVGSFRAGLRAERQRHGGAILPAPYTFYIAGALGSLSAALMLAGLSGLLGLVLISAYAQVQLMLSDYVQHYGLRRRIRADGRPEPTGPAHSWNAPHWYSSAMMLNAPRHSAHHARPGTAFPQLDLDADRMPMLPHSLPVMAVLALIPPLWRRIMDTRVDRWADAPPQGELMPEPA
ncbi:alkane 1-monooxygenase [Tateyamaria omphalii]|uniref:Alkane 1-monooxygenase n=1 Tax=Tateyamaria omphalii TaxID=299262 RepID=A0A1P8MSN6_9RHOB|nr:alkane 1-monooxygenase [Tateyamaria omphalii]APX11090.1 alkane 1-monooxygenase [Tateyamaria omphalii]